MSKLLLETIRCEDGQAHHLHYHQKRMDESLRALGLHNTHFLKQCITPPDKQLYRCRVVYDANTISVEYIPYVKRAISTLQLVQIDILEYALKYADRKELDILFTQRENADDILIVKDGLITDTSIANIAFYDGEQWLTPKHPLLHGTTRARLLDKKKIIEADITPSDLTQYSEFALINAMIGFNKIKNGIITPIKGAHDVV